MARSIRRSRPASSTAPRTTGRATTSAKHYEVAKYYTLDEHTIVPEVLVMSKAELGQADAGGPGDRPAGGQGQRRQAARAVGRARGRKSRRTRSRPPASRSATLDKQPLHRRDGAGLREVRRPTRAEGPRRATSRRTEVSLRTGADALSIRLPVRATRGGYRWRTRMVEKQTRLASGGIAAAMLSALSTLRALLICRRRPGRDDGASSPGRSSPATCSTTARAGPSPPRSC